jgi:molybdate transport system substrate-binding protein
MLQACARTAAPGPTELHVAAAANLTGVMPELGKAFEKSNGVRLVPSYGATAQLTQQITAGAPYDVLLAADTEHVDQLIKSGNALADSRFLYARGNLVLWAPKRPDLKTLNDITGPGVAGIIIAKPELAPYGAAAIEALKNAKLWDKLQSKNIVYAPNISAAKQFVDTGNGDAAFTALSLIIDQPGNYFLIDEKLYSPINQAMCITKNAKDAAVARSFTAFMKSDAAYAILQRYGYGRP